MRTQPLYLQQN